MTTQQINYADIGRKVETYCETYAIPLDYFFHILNDQKVVPMLRGKGMEYNALMILRYCLNSNEWAIHKLNPNPQPGSPDQDITITHLRTGIVLKVESKSAVRGSMTVGRKSKHHKNIPHFKVKCHRSRSNISLADTSNDRYSVNAFDVLITNPTNAVFKQGSVSAELELLNDNELINYLLNHYKVATKQELVKVSYEDWRFVIAAEIAEDGFIPRTPYVNLEADAHWLPMAALQTKLIDVVNQRLQSRKRAHRSSG